MGVLPEGAQQELQVQLRYSCVTRGYYAVMRVTNSYPLLRVSAVGSPPTPGFCQSRAWQPCAHPVSMTVLRISSMGQGTRIEPAPGARQRPAHLELGRTPGGEHEAVGPGLPREGTIWAQGRA